MELKVLRRSRDLYKIQLEERQKRVSDRKNIEEIQTFINRKAILRYDTLVNNANIKIVELIEELETLEYNARIKTAD
ncbi:MAG: hypothetical protein M3Q24_02735 [bacterium]|nr:hypothetical protein [bacterium]